MRRKLEYEEIFDQRPSPEDLKKLKRTPVVGLIENIRSMHNVGSIFRTSDGVRLEKLYLTGFTPYPPRPEIIKTALGATETVPWKYEKDPLVVIKKLKQDGFKIASVEHTTDSIFYSEVDYTFPLCVVFGNEVNGISEDVVSESDYAVDIPMLGVKHSLNVSVAYGIIMYHILSKYL